MLLILLKRSFWCIIVAFIILSGCGIWEKSGERVVISIGERRITEKDLKKDIKQFVFEMGGNDESFSKIIDPLIEKIVDHYLMLEWGRSRGINVSDDELKNAIEEIKRDYQGKDFQHILLENYVDLDIWRDRLKEQLLIKKILSKVTESITPVSIQEIKAYFDSSREEFKHPQMVKFRQVVTRNEDEAQKLLKRLAGGENMGELAKKYSITPEASKGGEVGWVSRGELDETMEKVVFSIPAGSRSTVVKTDYGYHIFEVLSKRIAGYKSLPEAMPEIEAKLFYKKKESYFQDWLKGLRDIFRVKIDRKSIGAMEFV